MFFGQGISFCHGLCLCFGQVEDRPYLFFEEKNLFYRSSSVDLDHLGNEEMFFFGPSVHVLQEPPFHLPEFFAMEFPAFSLEGLSELNQGIFEVVPESLDDMEVVILQKSLRPHFPNHFGECGPEVEDDTGGVNPPSIELSQKLFRHTTAIKPGDRFDIEDSNTNRISCNLFISASSSGHVFINGEGSGEFQLAQDLREVILGG